MLTARDAEIDKVVGLELGADDYVTKPFSSRELVARIRAVLRRRGGEDRGARRRTRWRRAGPHGRRAARGAVDGGMEPMPLKEFDLLELLLRNAGRVLTRGQLIDRVWGSDYVGDTKTLDVHVKRLRAKIEPDPADPAAPGHRARTRLQVRDLSAAGRLCSIRPGREGLVSAGDGPRTDGKERDDGAGDTAGGPAGHAAGGRLGRGLAVRPSGAAGQGEGVHPGPGRADGAAGRLPMVEVTADYRFTGPDGEVGLPDLFEGRRQLVVYHFMFDPDWDEGCPSCSFMADNIGHLSHLHARNTTLAMISGRATRSWPRTRSGWAGPCPGTRPGAASSTTTSRSRSTGTRPLGRQEDWEEPPGRSDGPFMGWLHRHDQYPH